MPILEEQYLRFEFADTWQVFQLDEHASYINWIEKLDGTKAVDFIGLYKGVMYFVEVKDFRKYRIQNQKRLTEGKLAIEFGQKVRDSIACIVGSYRNPAYTDFYREYFHQLEKDQAINLVLWIEYDLPHYNRKRKQVKSSVQSNIYKKKLRWFTSKVLVSNMETNILPETAVSNLSHTAD